jgi:hypothetical protein
MTDPEWIVKHRSDLGGLLARISEYAHLDDAAPHLFALAVATSSFLDDSPLWGMLVGPASGGKTEAIRLVEPIASEHVDTLTPASLLHWSETRGKPPMIPRGILIRIGDKGFVTIKDFSTVISDGGRGAGGRREDLFAVLRAIYDGELQRDLATGPAPLRWRGRLTLLAACTPTIDNYSAHADALGPRWLYLRFTARDTSAKRAMMRKAVATNASRNRQCAAEFAKLLCEQAASVIEAVELSDDLQQAVEDAALTLCYGRASVPRDSYGPREIVGLPDVEEPARVTKALAMLARCSLALGVTEDEANALLSRVAIDTMPATRARALGAIVTAPRPITSTEVGRHMGTVCKVAQRAVEDFEALGLVRRVNGETEPEAGAAKKKPWIADHPDVELIRGVYQRALQAMPFTAPLERVPKCQLTTPNTQEEE